MENYYLKVINPEKIGTDKLPAELIELEGKGNYKPNIGIMPDGELVLFALHQHFEDPAMGGAYTTHSVMYKSQDDGRTWAKGRHMRFFGHEPSITIIDGVIFVLTHFLSNEDYAWETMADEDYTYDMLYRSTDCGNTWQDIPLKYEMFDGADKANMAYTRNIFKLADGRLFLGITVGAKDYACCSDDMGKTWKNHKADTKGYTYNDNYPWGGGVFGESVLFNSPSGRFMMLSRMDLAYVSFDPPLPFEQKMDNKTAVDHYDSEILFESIDGGITWKPIRAVGFPALMYPGVVNLPDGRLLVNYTVREIPPEGTGSVHPRIGVQAVLVEEREDGFMDFSMTEDVIIIDDKTSGNLTSGGGFGRTVMLKDGTLVTPYSYMWADADVMRMVENEEYLNAEVFNKYGSMLASPVTFESRSKTKELLRMSFAVTWGFNELMNKAGIRTDIVRWRLPQSFKQG